MEKMWFKGKRIFDKRSREKVISDKNCKKLVPSYFGWAIDKWISISEWFGEEDYGMCRTIGGFFLGVGGFLAGWILDVILVLPICKLIELIRGKKNKN